MPGDFAQHLAKLPGAYRRVRLAVHGQADVIVIDAQERHARLAQLAAQGLERRIGRFV